MDNRAIGVFDSGVGGLSVVKELIHLLPDENIVYFGDTGRVPYGTRSRETIIKYAKQDIAFLLEHDVKLIVCACGTVSSVLPEDVVNGLPVPLVNILVPSCQSACAMSTTGKIGVIGTSASIKSGAFGKMIRNIRSDTKIFGNSCPLLIPLVEEGMVEDDNQITKLLVEYYLNPLKREGIDTLILGSTHFPILYNTINEALDYKVTLVDTGRATAEFARNYLSKNNMLAQESNDGDVSFYVTDSIDSFNLTAVKFLGVDIKANAHCIDIDTLHE